MTDKEKILLVDDDPLVLDAMVRQLRKTYPLETAMNGTEALDMLSRCGPYAVVVSDLRMPGMDGISLLKEVRKQYPAVTRVILTGNADLTKAIEAVNSGQVFRFLTKPCPANALATTLALGVRQYQLITSEQELLDKTLKGSITMLTEILSLTNPRAFSRGYRIRNAVVEIAKNMGIKSLWRLEVAALVSQVGCVAVPEDILGKIANDVPLTESERSMFADHPRIGARLVGRIPRLEGVAEIIRNQLQPYGDTELIQPQQDETGTAASILKAVLDYDRIVTRGITHEEAVSVMYSRLGMYNPDVLENLKTFRPRFPREKNITAVLFDELVPGMIAAEDIVAKNGSTIIEKGQEITWPALQGLQNFITHIGIKEPIRVWVQ